MDKIGSLVARRLARETGCCRLRAERFDKHGSPKRTQGEWFGGKNPLLVVLDFCPNVSR